MPEEAYIVSAVRTPIGKFGRSLAPLSAVELGAIVIKEAVRRAGIGPKDVEEVIMGNVLSGGLGQNPARQAAQLAGIPEEVDAFTVNKVCASGLRAVASAAQAIKAGDEDIVVAGGMESMSNAPFILPARLRWGVKLIYWNPPQLVDLLVWDGLRDPFLNMAMGEIADREAKRHKVSRREADEFAYMSHMRAAEATEKGYFKEEIVPIDVEKDGVRIFLDRDEGIRPDTSIEKLSRLKPVFTKDGVTTAGNASQISDGASAVVVMSGRKVEELGVKPLAKIIGYSWGAMGEGNFIVAPVPVTRKLLKKLGMTIDDVDLVEHNEAFAVASIIVSRMLGIPFEKLNVHGGAIALGHPIGASGARILTTLIYALRRRGLKRGLATICHGGGGALSMVIELV